MIPARKFFRLSRRRQVYWLFRGLQELEAAEAGGTPSPDEFYRYYVRPLIAEQLRLERALESQWQRWCSALIGPLESAQTRAAERRELEELLRQLCAAEPSDWSPSHNCNSPEEQEDQVSPSTKAMEGKASLRLYLDRVRSPFNVGSIFRSAAAFAVNEVWLHSHCPDLQHPRTQRTAMGSIACLNSHRCDEPQCEAVLQKVPWLGLETPDVVARYAKQNSKARSKVAWGPQSFPSGGGLLLVGEEEGGLRAELLEYCASADNRCRGGGLLSIPMPGAKQSLNLAVATAIALQRWSELLAEANLVSQSRV